MEHISLATPNFIIWHTQSHTRVSFNPREITVLRHSVIRDLLIPARAAWEFEIRTQWQVAVKTLRLYPDIHLTKIFTWRNNYILLWIVIDGELIARREAITGQWTLSRCHAQHRNKFVPEWTHLYREPTFMAVLNWGDTESDNNQSDWDLCPLIFDLLQPPGPGWLRKYKI